MLVLACAHCHKQSGPKREWAGGQGLLQQQCERSARAHAELCSIPVRPALRRTS